MENVTVVKDGRTVFAAKVDASLADKTLDFAKGLGGDLTTSIKPKEKKEEKKVFNKKEDENPEDY